MLLLDYRNWQLFDLVAVRSSCGRIIDRLHFRTEAISSDFDGWGDADDHRRGFSQTFSEE